MSQTKIKAALLFLITSFFAISTQAAPKYIDFKPMSEVAKTPIANVKGGVKTLPIITWGGDIATIYGNGSGKRTAKGSIFAKQGLSYNLQRQDVFSNQVKAYLAGETPFLRGTVGMMSLASDALNKDPRTKPVVFYQMTWSAGGDALVVKNSIKTAKDLKGKSIAIQAYGPHVDYLLRLLKDAGLSHTDVKLKWLPDLTGTDNSPMAAFYEKDVDAAFVIIPDALALTSGGNVGTGAEDSVKGAKILLSTKTANRVIADVYAVRSDYYKANKSEIENLSSALIKSEEALKKLFSNRTSNSAEYKKMISGAALLLLDAAEAVSDTEGLYADCEFVGAKGNVDFFQSSTYPRRFEKIRNETAQSLRSMGLVQKGELAATTTNFKQLAGGAPVKAETKRFNRSQVSAVVNKRQQQGTLSDGEIFSFEVFFKPNQNSFSADLYAEEFAKVVNLASIYGGAIITIEGHSDPMGYLRAKKGKSNAVVLNRIKQSAKNLSISRASEVRNEIISYATSKSVALDESQFEPLGLGISQPNTGICGTDPCAPKNEKEWRSNMRVVFRLIQIEAETDAFIPL